MGAETKDDALFGGLKVVAVGGATLLPLPLPPVGAGSLEGELLVLPFCRVAAGEALEVELDEEVEAEAGTADGVGFAVGVELASFGVSECGGIV